MPTHLSFKISTLNALFVPKDPVNGLLLPNPPNTTSLCLIGPDGTGKSVFALHLASAYCDGLSEKDRANRVRVLYVSTDLKYHRAVEVLDHFGMDGSVLTELTADASLDRLQKYLSENIKGRKKCEIGFFDLAASTAGDDWGLVNRLLASLPDADADAARHLVVIDAVEGLETMVGDRDAFGLLCTRRQRIANLMRLAEQKAHVVLVVEEAEAGKKHPEEFVADYVLRLRATIAGNFTRRTLEIEKARALGGYADGQHPFHIGKGYSEHKENHDVVEVFQALPSVSDEPEVRQKEKKDNSEIVEVFLGPPSVSDEPEVPQATCQKRDTLLKFKLKYLDGMLNEDKGLSPGTVVAIIGEASTLKSDLGYHFLADAFEKHDPCSGLAILFSSDPDSETRLKAAVGTQDRDFGKWAYCKQFPATDLPAAQVYWMIRGYLKDAVDRFTPDDTSSKIFVHRLVIDDLSSFRDTYPEIAQDPLFLPKLVRFLENGIQCKNSLFHFFVTVLVSTQDGRPGVQTTDRFDESLRNLVSFRIQTWHVQFYDQQRVAISTNTAAHDTGPVVVRELCRRKRDDRTVPFVDPHFELYRDLELGKPERVALEVRMFSETEAFDKYIESENHLLNELFLPRNPSTPGGSVITKVPASQYESLRDFCNLKAGTNSEHTLILQVDEFWDPPEGAFRTQKGYLIDPIIASLNKSPDHEEDPMSIFKSSETSGEELKLRRKLAKVSKDEKAAKSNEFSRSDFFVMKGRARGQQDPDRVPFMWDYGFLLLDPRRSPKSGHRLSPQNRP